MIERAATRPPPRIAVVEHATKVKAAARTELRAALTAAGLDASWHRVAKAKRATAAVRSAIDDGADVVVVCGGDGTVRAAAQALVDTGVALAVVPDRHGQPVRQRPGPADRRRRTSSTSSRAVPGRTIDTGRVQRLDVQRDGRHRVRRRHDRGRRRGQGRLGRAVVRAGRRYATPGAAAVPGRR